MNFSATALGPQSGNPGPTDFGLMNPGPKNPGMPDPAPSEIPNDLPPQGVPQPPSETPHDLPDEAPPQPPREVPGIRSLRARRRTTLAPVARGAA